MHAAQNVFFTSFCLVSARFVWFRLVLVLAALACCSFCFSAGVAELPPGLFADTLLKKGAQLEARAKQLPTLSELNLPKHKLVRVGIRQIPLSCRLTHMPSLA